MSKWDKLLTRICVLSKDLRLDELHKVLKKYGYVMNAPKGGSSHYTFRKAGYQPITIPKHETIKIAVADSSLNRYNEMAILWQQKISMPK